MDFYSIFVFKILAMDIPKIFAKLTRIDSRYSKIAKYRKLKNINQMNY